jgi:hypothetical protein
MKNVFLLLLVIGIPVAAWWHKDRLMAFVNPSAPPGEVAGEATTPSSGDRRSASGVPTPHPARDAQLAATKAYPALNNPNSAFNKKFLALYAETKSRDPHLLAAADWPLKIADRTAVALGGAPMAVPSTPVPVEPSGLQGSSLDKKPKPRH